MLLSFDFQKKRLILSLLQSSDPAVLEEESYASCFIKSKLPRLPPPLQEITIRARDGLENNPANQHFIITPPPSASF